MSRSLFTRIRNAYRVVTTIDPIAVAVFNENNSHMASARGWFKPRS